MVRSAAKRRVSNHGLELRPSSPSRRGLRPLLRMRTERGFLFRKAVLQYMKSGGWRRPMLELYHDNLSVCAQKVRIVLAEKNMPWTNHHVNLASGEHLTPAFKAMNPRAVVPVLIHGGNT